MLLLCVCFPQNIDFENELIKLSSTEPTEVRDLPRRISKDCARYHFFLYKHSHEGDYLESTGEYVCAQELRRKSRGGVGPLARPLSPSWFEHIKCFKARRLT